MQLDDFLNQINTTSLCYTPDCVGKLIPISIKHIGLGGGLNFLVQDVVNGFLIYQVEL